MFENNKVIINSITYIGSGLLLNCFNLFLLPLYTSYLSTEEYGVITIALSFVQSALFLVSFSLFNAVNRFYVDYKNDTEKLKRFYGTITVFVFVSSLIWVLLLALLRDYISGYIFNGVPYYPIIFVTSLLLIFSSQHRIFDTILKSQQQATKSSSLSILFFFVNLAFNIVLVVWQKLGAVGCLVATTLSYLLFFFYFVIDLLIHNQIKFCIDKDILKDSLKYSIPIIPHNLSTILALLISQIFIGNYDAIGSVGVFSIASKFAHVADTIQTYVSKAYMPWLFERLSSSQISNSKDTIRKVSNALLAIIGLFFVGISLFAQDYILLCINKSYVDSWKYVAMIIGVYSIKTMYYFYVSVLFYYKKTSRLLFIATLSGSLINILISFWLIPIWGINGSILADAIAMVVRVAIVVFISKKEQDIGLSVGDFIKHFLIVNGFVLVGLIMSFIFSIQEFSLLNLIYKVCVVFVYVAWLTYDYREELYCLLARYKSKWKAKKNLEVG